MDEKSQTTQSLCAQRGRYLRWAGVTLVLSGWALYRLWQRRCQRGARRVGLVPCPEAAPAPPPVEPAPEPIEITAFVALEESAPAPETPVVAAPLAPDDLRRIEGIGSKVAALLGEAGISTYAQLAAAAPDHLREVLQAAGLRFMDPATWPEQAALAAQGDWEGLVALQGALKGGRRA